MKIVILGALGHIGSSLIRVIPSLIDTTEIILVDNFRTQRYCSLFDLDKSLSYQFYNRDIVSDDIEDITQGCDIIINLAAITDAAQSFDNADEVERVNFLCLKNAVNSAIKNNAKLIHLSSTSVYGTQVSEVDENCKIDDLKPQSPYALSKINEENFLKQTNDLKFTILRFGTIFGIAPGIRFHTAVNKFCFQACMREPLTVWTTALNQKRPYLDIGDATKSRAFVIEKNLFDSEIFNVVTCNFTVNDILNEIKAFIPDVEINLVDHEIMNQLSYEVSSKKIMDKGFEFNGSISTEIEKTISLFKGIKNKLK